MSLSSYSLMIYRQFTEQYNYWLLAGCVRYRSIGFITASIGLWATEWCYAKIQSQLMADVVPCIQLSRGYTSILATHLSIYLFMLYIRCVTYLCCNTVQHIKQ